MNNSPFRIFYNIDKIDIHRIKNIIGYYTIYRRILVMIISTWFTNAKRQEKNSITQTSLKSQTMIEVFFILTFNVYFDIRE